MPLETLSLSAVLVAALVFGYTNGFHDAPNSLATAISTRALGPRAAVIMAASMNVIGALLGEGVARTISRDIINPPEGPSGLAVLLAALIGAIAWNVATWYKGMPSSSSHALVGGMVGAALASTTTVQWRGVAVDFALPMLVSPLIGGLLGFFAMVAILWLFRRTNVRRMTRGFKIAQSASAAAMALGHGLQDAQKTMGVIVLALIASGYQSSYDVPMWTVFAAAGAMALGTLTGGWRIMRTLGRRVIQLDAPRGFAAESTVAAVSYATSFIWEVPISNTHMITSAIVGVGATRRLSAVRWGVAGNILAVWLATVPGAAVVSAAAYVLVSTALPT
ncbi:inorganic phosphate transporter [Streptomonospora litoralis]|uniref:Low-affinity inorganic phosphate transporter 1 n=1 Tax=Streptomonospora litoralis TaxID=2498135 RepID=A0A4P6PVQ0_9ACTN|nr:inorganic phosphate transporter [Streptomonospora litoralis]QBI52135.1 Low-affinity inorganic phosphate transporter 1 [Streptomonospora litoralis]